MRKVAAIGLLASAACSSFGTEAAPADAGADSAIAAERAPQQGTDAGASSTADALAPDFCTQALADARGALFSRCLQYDVDAPLDLNAYGGASAARDSAEFRSPPASLRMHYPANPPPGGNGVSQGVATNLVAKRIELAFDVLVQHTAGKTASHANLAGFTRGKVHTSVIYDFRTREIMVLEQDQRGSTVNYLEGALEVDLASWHRIVLSVNYETRRSELRADNGSRQADLPLVVPLIDAPGGFVIGAPYAADNTELIAYHFDNVVLHAW